VVSDDEPVPRASAPPLSRGFVRRLAWIGSLGVIVSTALVATTVALATGEVGTSIGLSLAGGALLLAAVAAWAATLAYADTLRAPRLTWKVGGGLLDPRSQIPLTTEEPPYPYKESTNPPGAILWSSTASAKHATLEIRITNVGDATARNVLATMKFSGLRVLSIGGLSGWKARDADDGFYASIFEWDAGREFAVHPLDRSRDAPTATLGRFYLTSYEFPSVQLDVVCDGFDLHDTVTEVLTGLVLPKT
jgi:hypothetical protein